MIKFLQCAFILLVGCATEDENMMHDTADTHEGGAIEKAELGESKVDYSYETEDLINVIVNLKDEDVEFYKNGNIYSRDD